MNSFFFNKMCAIKEFCATLTVIFLVIFFFLKYEMIVIISLVINGYFVLLTNIVSRFARIYLDLIASIVGTFAPSRKGKVPAITDRLLLRPASQLVNDIKSGKVHIHYYLSLFFIKIVIKFNKYLIHNL